MSGDISWGFFDRPADAVETNLETMNTRADAAISSAQSTISALSSFTVDPEGDIPEFSMPEISLAPPVTPAGPSNISFGTIPGAGSASIDALTVDYSTTLDSVAPFAPTVGVPTTPSPLGALDVGGAPGTPPTITPIATGSPLSADSPGPLSLDSISIPSFGGITDPPDPGFVDVTVDPVPPITLPPDPAYLTIAVPSFGGIVTPGDPQFDEINLPTFAGVTDPGIDDTEPVFEGAIPSFSFTAPADYTGPLTAQIRAWIEGQGGLPASVQQALFDAARSRDDQSALAAEQEAFDTFAARGFAMPPGMLAETLSIAQERSRFARSTINRDIAAKVAEIAAENIRAAVAAGVALESALIASHDRVAQLTFDAAKGQADIEARLYEAAVTLYNARQSARQVKATIYKAKWDGELAKVQVYKTQVDGQVAKGALNDARARVYSAKWDGERARVEVFKAEASVETEKSKVNDAMARVYTARVSAETAKAGAYEAAARVQVARAGINDSKARAYAAQWEGQGFKVKAYEAEVQGETAKATVNDHRARGYVAQWEGVKAAADVYATGMRGAQIASDTQRATIDAYAASVRAWSDTVSVRKLQYDAWAEGARVEVAKASVFEAQARAFAETVRAQESAANVKLKKGEVQIAAYRAETERYSAKLQQLRDMVAAELANIESTAKAYAADTGRYTAEIQGANQARASEIQVAELRLRNDLALHEAQLRSADSSLSRQIERVKIVLEALKSTGQISSTLAAGAMSAIHVQASISGSGSVSSSTSLQRTQKLADAT